MAAEDVHNTRRRRDLVSHIRPLRDARAPSANYRGARSTNNIGSELSIMPSLSLSLQATNMPVYRTIYRWHYNLQRYSRQTHSIRSYITCQSLEINTISRYTDNFTFLRSRKSFLMLKPAQSSSVSNREFKNSNIYYEALRTISQACRTKCISRKCVRSRLLMYCNTNTRILGVALSQQWSRSICSSRKECSPIFLWFNCVVRITFFILSPLCAPYLTQRLCVTP